MTRPADEVWDRQREVLLAVVDPVDAHEGAAAPVESVRPSGGGDCRAHSPAHHRARGRPGRAVTTGGPSPVPGVPDGGAVRYQLADGAATIVLARPERGNPIDLEMAQGLLQAVRQARRDDARVVVLRAEGKAFCVGGDVSGMASADDREHHVEELAETLHRAVSDLQRLDAVVVSAVQGVAAGAGVPLAAAADLVLAAASARFTLAYTRIGLTPDGGSSLLVASTGLHRALHLALLNPLLTADEAREAGLVAQVHPDDELDAAVAAVVGTLLAGSRTAQVAAKHLLRGQALPYPEGAMRRETLAIRAAAGGPDGREGVDAFVAKRRPVFPSGRP